MLLYQNVYNSVVKVIYLKTVRNLNIIKKIFKLKNVRKNLRNLFFFFCFINVKCTRNRRQQYCG